MPKITSIENPNFDPRKIFLNAKNLSHCAHTVFCLVLVIDHPSSMARSEISQTKQLLSSLENLDRKMMLNSEMTFANTSTALLDIGSHLPPVVSSLLNFKTPGLFSFSLEKVTRKIFCVYLTSRISYPPPSQSLHTITTG